MSEKKETLKTFQDLKAWQDGHQLVLSVYQLTKILPTDERFGLISQMRRAGVSITSNITEGFGRRTYKDKARFYITAQGSVSELQNQLIIARDLAFISNEVFQKTWSESLQVHRLLTGLIRATQARS